MAAIISMEGAVRRRPVGIGGRSGSPPQQASILFFTGVRIERRPETGAHSDKGGRDNEVRCQD